MSTLTFLDVSSLIADCMGFPARQVPAILRRVRLFDAKGLLDTIGYGHASTVAMETIKDEQAVKDNLSPIDAPILAQTPNDPAQREKQLAEFEKIKAGF